MPSESKKSQKKPARTDRNWPTAVDLYSGSGAVTAALASARYRVVAAVDQDPIACKTFRTNHNRVHLYETDIRELDPETILVDDLARHKLDLLVVCAPCQPFSSQNKKRGKPNDLRLELIFEAVRFAAVLQPKVIFFENVSGLAAPRFECLLKKLEAQLGEQGFLLGRPKRVDAAHFGVPQRRIRCVMIAASGNIDPDIDWDPLKRPERTVRQTIGHLPVLGPGETDPCDVLHRARQHSKLNLQRLIHVPIDGGSRFSLPIELELACHKGFGGHPDVYGRMKWDDVAPTLTTGCTDITRGRFAHPQSHRAITLREASLLQSFPEDYQFIGNSSQIARQIGNSVPFQMAKEMMTEIRLLLQ